MKAQAIVLLAVLLFTATCGGNLWFDLGRCRVNNSGSWRIVTIPCSGGSGSYDWSWDYVPAGWRTYRNQLWAPVSAPVNQYYGVRVGVTDNIYGGNLQRAVVFNLGSSGVNDAFDTDYTYAIDSPTQFTTLVNNRQVTIRISTGAPAAPTVPVYTPPVSSTPSYTFPTDSQIDERLMQGDVAWVRNQINGAIGSGAGCRAVADFLSRLLSRISAQLSLLRQDSSDTRSKIRMLQEEVTFLRQQISDLRNKSMDANSIKAMISQYTNDLNSERGALSGYRTQISNLNSQIRGY